MNNSTPDKTQLKKLFELAGKIVKNNPWESVPGDLVFGVDLLGDEKTGYIQTIGQLDDVFGVLIYRGETALHRVRRFNGQHSMVELDMFSVIFEDPENLPEEAFCDSNPETAEVWKECSGFPVFMSHTPGYIPVQIRRDETAMLTEYLEQALEVYSRNDTKQFHDLDTSEMECLYRIKFMGQWVDSLENIPPSAEIEDEFKLNSKTLKKIWRLPSGVKGTQASLILFPGCIGEPGQRPSTAYLLLVVDEETGFAAHHLLTPGNSLREMELSVPEILLEKIAEIGSKPVCLSIPQGDKLYDLIEQMGIEKIPFPVKEMEEELEPLETICDELCDSVATGKAPATGQSTGGKAVNQIKLDGKTLQIKVSLMGNKRIYRKIAIRDDQTLDDLHEAIFYAFDREEEHLYSYFLPDRPTQSKRVIMDSREFSPPEEDSAFSFREHGNSFTTTIGSLGLREKQKFYYLFDWGDEWWHELTFEGESSSLEKELPAVITSRGESPPQYPDWDE